MSILTGTLIVGAGQAGAQLAVSLREYGYKKPITMIGDEPALPYQRPPLSKDYLLGRLESSKLSLRKAKFYESKKIDVMTSAAVVEAGIDDDGGWAITDDGLRIEFEHLALTTGSRPRPLPLDSKAPENLYYVRTLEDANRFQSELAEGQRFVVVGGGFIGLEAAAVLNQHDKEVTVVELADRLVGRVASEDLGQFYLDAHRRRGTEFRLGRRVERVEFGPNGRASAVVLDDGEVLECDAIVAGLGVVRDPGLAAQLGIAWDDGVVVDERAKTSHPRIVAAGDCTVGPHPMSDIPIRLESVQNAIDQAKVAAATICGLGETYSAVPWFWSNQGSLKLQMAGLIPGADRKILRGDPLSEQFSVIYLRGSYFAAIETMNRPRDFTAARKLLAQGARLMVSEEKLADPDTPLTDSFECAAPVI